MRIRGLQRPIGNERGMTLVELMIALAVFAIILVPIMLILTGAGRGFTAGGERSRLERQARQAVAAISGALTDTGADPTGGRLFEAVPEAAVDAIVVAADLRGERPGSPPDGDADDLGERRGFRLLPGGTLVAEVQHPGEPFGMHRRTLCTDVSGFSLTYYDLRGEEICPRELGDERTGHQARSRIRTIAVRLELYTPAAGQPVIVTTRVSPPNLAVGGIYGATGGGFPFGAGLDHGAGPAVPAEDAPPVGPPELISLGAAAELRGAGIGDPVVYFDSPAAGARLSGPTPVGAAAFDVDGTVRQVEFYLNDRVLGADGYAPYEIPGRLWNPRDGEFAVADGHHLLYALAIDNRNNLGSDALMVEVHGNGGPALLLDATRPAGVSPDDPRSCFLGLRNAGDAPLVLTELRATWERPGLLLSEAVFDGVTLYRNNDGLAPGEAVRLTTPLSLPPGGSGELTLRFTATGSAARSLGGARLAMLAADGAGRRWGLSCHLTPTAHSVGGLAISGSHHTSRWQEYYRLTRLILGSTLYTDERYRITGLPVTFEAPLWLSTPNVDRNKGLGEPSLGADFHGTLRVDNRVHLYLLFDDTATPPLWVRERFLRSRYVVTTEGPEPGRLRLWLSAAPPGQISFYGARSAGASDNVSAMYLLGLGGVFAPGVGR